MKCLIEKLINSSMNLTDKKNMTWKLQWGYDDDIFMFEL